MLIRQQWITRAQVRANRSTVYVFGDNMQKRGYGGQAREMRGEYNTIGIPTKWSPEKYFTEADWWMRENVQERIRGALDTISRLLTDGGDVVIPSDGVGTGLAELPSRAPSIDRYITERIALLEAEYGQS